MKAERFRGHDGTQLAYRDVGSGQPLVLLHGFMGTSGQWLDGGPVAALVDRGFRLLVPDLRGHGDSEAPQAAAAYPPDVLAADGLAFIDHLGLVAGEYDLAGYSLGGRIVVRMLARGAQPRRAIAAGQGLAKVCGPQGGGLIQRTLQAMADGTPLAPGSPEDGIAQWVVRFGFDARALLGVMGSLVPTPERDVRAITIPTLVMIGDQDERSDADELAALLPHGRFATVPGNHETAATSPEFAAELEAFLSE